jgi:hypothetical protein
MKRFAFILVLLMMVSVRLILVRVVLHDSGVVTMG